MAVMRHLGGLLAVAGLACAAPVAAGQAQPASDLRSMAANHSNYGVAHFYEARDYRPLWVRDGQLGAESRQLLAFLRRGAAEGVVLDQTMVTELGKVATKVGPGRSADNARAELMLSDAWVQYVQALSKSTGAEVTYIDASLVPRDRFPAAILNDAANAPSLGAHMIAVAKLNPIYGGLLDGLVSWRERWGGLPPRPIAAGKSLKKGDRGDRVELLRMSLGVDAGAVFDDRTATALVAFKKSKGLGSDAVADSATVAKLNDSVAATERRLLLNLGRARVLPAASIGKYIVVDAASARLWLFENGKAIDSMKVVIGKPDEQTPMAAGLIRSMVLNPYWNIPPDLVQERIAPRVLSDGLTYLKSSRYQVLSDWTDKAKVLDPKTVNWKAVAAGDKTIRLRQLPGGSNAMGTMKFLFPNSFGVYLHDTPKKELFAQQNRALSSGCVRLEDAPRLARWLFGTAPPSGGKGPEQLVPLPKPVPVYLTYFTTRWDNPELAANADIYGRDAPTSAKTKLMKPTGEPVVKS